MRNNKMYLMIVMLIVVMLGLSSISYAKDITVDENNGTADNPITIGLSDYETVVHYGDTKLPFYFKIQNNGDNVIGLYKISMNQKSKTVTFTLTSTRKSVGTVGNSYGVTPGNRSTGVSYFQAGAILDDDGIGNVAMYPVYLIKEIQDYTGGNLGATIAGWSLGMVFGPFGGFTMAYWANKSNIKIKTITLGNAYENIENGIDTKTYVFSATNTPVNKLMEQSNRQATENMVPRLDNSSAITFKGSETPSIVYAFYGVSSEVLSSDPASWLEGFITKIGLIIGDVFMNLIRKLPGGWLSVDTIIFNQYKPTVVDFFNTSSSSGLYTSAMHTVINAWFRNFLNFAKVILLMVLPVIGIRAMLFAGTPKQRDLPNLLSGWVIAVVLLYFGPYIMKYIIQINDSIVATIRGQSKYSMTSVYSNDFGEKYHYQMGEDSETNMLARLNELKTIVSEEAQKQYEKVTQAKAEYEEKLKARTESLRKVMQMDKIIADVKKAMENNTGTPYRKLSDTEIKALVEGGQFLKLGATTTTTKVGLSLNPDMATKQAEEFVKNTGTDPKDIRIYYNLPTQKQTNSGSTSLPNLPGNSTGLGTNLPGTAFVKNIDILAPDEVTEAFSKYLQEKAIYDDMMQDLEDIEKAIEIEQKGLDLMGIMREKAGESYRLVFLLIWFLLIYQMLMMLFLYYKRLITIAALIAIFPLSVMMYGVEKAMGIAKPKSMHTWMVEYIINIFIQTVHALLYITLVEGGLSIYEQDPDNWLLFVFAVFALIPMESIVKAIIGLSAASVLGLKDYSNGAAAKINAAKDTAKIGKDASGDIDKKTAAKEARAAQKQNRHDINAERRQNNAIARAKRKGKSPADIQRINDKYARRSKRLNGADGTGGLRGLNRKRRKITGYAKKAIFKARNIAAMGGVFTTGIAAGGDFAKGVAVATAIAGTRGKTDGSSAKARSQSRAPTNKAPTSRPTSSSTSPKTGNGNPQVAPTQGQSGTPGTTTPNTQNAQNTAQQGQINPLGGTSAATTSANDNAAAKLNNHEKVASAFSEGLSGRNTSNVNTNETYRYSEK